MTEDIQKIVAELPGLTDVSGVKPIVDERVARGEAAFAADLGIALSAAGKAAEPSAWQYEAVLEHLLRLLATTPGPGNAAQALRLVASAFDSSGKGARYPASLLATGHAAEDLVQAFTGAASDELRSCLLQELVLRGAPVVENPAIATWAAAPERLGHPLSWLPLTLSGIESEAALPSHGGGGSGGGRPVRPGRPRCGSAGRGPQATRGRDTT
ncbi:DUF6183 family protein, partial [Streptomyces wedmorensis]